MNLLNEKSPCLCRVRQMFRLRCEVGGVKILGGGEKTGRAGWTQPSAEVVVGPTPIPELIKGRGHSFDEISQAGERRSYAVNHTPRNGKIILAVESRGSVSFGGVDQRYESGCRDSSSPRTVQVILRCQSSFLRHLKVTGWSKRKAP
jgi:hypothetical protein